MAATESYGHVIRPTPRHYVRCLLEARDLLEAEVAQYVLGELVPVGTR